MCPISERKVHEAMVHKVDMDCYICFEHRQICAAVMVLTAASGWGKHDCGQLTPDNLRKARDLEKMSNNRLPAPPITEAMDRCKMTPQNGVIKVLETGWGSILLPDMVAYTKTRRTGVAAMRHPSTDALTGEELVLTDDKSRGWRVWWRWSTTLDW